MGCKSEFDKIGGGNNDEGEEKLNEKWARSWSERRISILTDHYDDSGSKYVYYN